MEMKEKYNIVHNILELSTINMECYPVSLDEIKDKVNKKNGRNGRKHSLLNKYIDFGDIDHPHVKEQINEFGEKILRVDGEIPTNLHIEDGQRFLFISYDQSILTHGIHKYPAKFFPELPRWLIKRYSNEYETLLDPFAGSGTTNIEALLNKRHSVGIDVDPFSRYLAKVKTTPLNGDELKNSSHMLLEQIVDYDPSYLNDRDIPDFPYRDNWFNKEILLELAYIKRSVQELNVDQKIKDFYRICFSSIIRSVSNADNNCTRTVIRKRLNKKVCPSDALTRFSEKILTEIPKMIEFSKIYPQDVKIEFPVDSDARDIKYDEGYFDLVITSPPYANAVDYPRTHQLEIYWLGFENGSLTPLKRRHVGTESVMIKEYRSLHKTGVEEADKVISKIYTKDPRRAYIGYKYLSDMNNNLEETYRVLKKNGRYVIVIGSNRIRGQTFENWKYLTKLAKKVGFELESYFASEIIKHFIKVPRAERINTDWVIVLRK